MSTIKAGTTTTTAFSVDQDTTGDLNFQAGSVTPLSIKSTGLVSVSNTASFKLPVGTIAQRPASPQNGMMRFNSDMNEVEVYSGGKWQAISSGNLKLKLDFDETTTLDSRISFTRATNGTFFNSSGVLSTATSGVARFDHRLEGGVWVNKGLLIEEQRTNICIQSEDLATSWNTPAAGTLTTNQTTAPDGTTTADKFTENNANATHGIETPSITFVANTTYTASIFVKRASGTRNLLIAWPSAFFTGRLGYFDLANGTVNSVPAGTTGSIQDCGNGWFRCSMTTTSGGSGGSARVAFILLDGTTITYTGDNTSALFFWGAQLEVAAFPTSYIATTNASVTRNQDVATMTSTNFSSWFNATEGTMYCLWDNIGFNPVNNYVWQIDDTTSLERYYLVATNTVAFSDVTDGNVPQVTGFSSSYTPVLYQRYANALAYKANDFATSFNGVTPVTDNSGSLPTVTRLVLGEAHTTSTRPLNGHVAKFYYWNTRRSNEVLQNLTE